MLQINTNPDLDDYKETLIAGMTAKEALWAGAGILSGAVVCIFLKFFFHLPMLLCVYASAPVIIPFILTGFSIKDGMTYWQRRRRKKNRRQSKPLGYVSTENRRAYLEAGKQKMVENEGDKEEEFQLLMRKMKFIGIAFGILVVGIIVILFFTFGGKK